MQKLARNQRTLSDFERLRFDSFPSIIGFVSGSVFTWAFIDGVLFFFKRGFRTLPVGVKFVGIFTLVIGSGCAVRHSSLYTSSRDFNKSTSRFFLIVIRFT